MEPNLKDGSKKKLIKRRNLNLRRGSQSQFRPNEISSNKLTLKKDENQFEAVKSKVSIHKSGTPSTLTSLKSSTSTKIEIPMKKTIRIKQNTINSVFKQINEPQLIKEKKDMVN
jgi:hypothetical protein